jgi:hypothetical protein
VSHHHHRPSRSGRGCPRIAEFLGICDSGDAKSKATAKNDHDRKAQDSGSSEKSSDKGKSSHGDAEVASDQHARGPQGDGGEGDNRLKSSRSLLSRLTGALASDPDEDWDTGGSEEDDEDDSRLVDASESLGGLDDDWSADEGDDDSGIGIRGVHQVGRRSWAMTGADRLEQGLDAESATPMSHGYHDDGDAFSSWEPPWLDPFQDPMSRAAFRADDAFSAPPRGGGHAAQPRFDPPDRVGSMSPHATQLGGTPHSPSAHGGEFNQPHISRDFSVPSGMSSAQRPGAAPRETTQKLPINASRPDTLHFQADAPKGHR